MKLMCSACYFQSSKLKHACEFPNERLLSYHINTQTTWVMWQKWEGKGWDWMQIAEISLKKICFGSGMSILRRFLLPSGGQMLLAILTTVSVTALNWKQRKQSHLENCGLPFWNQACSYTCKGKTTPPILKAPGSLTTCCILSQGYVSQQTVLKPSFYSAEIIAHIGTRLILDRSLEKLILSI